MTNIHNVSLIYKFICDKVYFYASLVYVKTIAYICAMGFLKSIFKRKGIKPSSWVINEIDFDDGDVEISFIDDLDNWYILDLEWEDGKMSIEFGLLYDKEFDTTNFHQHYKILGIIHWITNEIIERIDDNNAVDIHTITFKSSKKKGGKDDEQSKSVRDRFFIRYITRDYPEAKVTEDNGEILIQLYAYEEKAD